MPRTAKVQKDYSTLSVEDRYERIVKSLKSAQSMIARALEEAEDELPNYTRIVMYNRMARADTLEADAVTRSFGVTEEA